MPNTTLFSFFSSLRFFKVLFLFWGIFLLPCLGLGQDFEFNTQAELDNFDPTITSISGSIILENSSITDLSPLENLTNIGGDLNLENTEVTSLEGLNNLEQIGGFLNIYSNNFLTNLNGFSNLSSVGGRLVISYNDSLTDVSGFSNLNSIGGYFTISNNGSMTNLNGFSNLSFVNEHLYLGHNYSLTNLDGLSNLSSIGGYLHITTNIFLTNIDGLTNLSSIGGYLRVRFNNMLPNLNGFANLNSISGSIRIEDNAFLTNLDGFANLNSIENYVEIRDNPSLTNLDGFANLNSIGGFLHIRYNNTLTNVDGFANLSSVDGEVFIQFNDALTNLDGFANLGSIGGYLDIRDNDSITNVGGFANVSSVGEYLSIGHNSNLSNCCILLPLLSNPDAIGSEIYIFDNNFPCNSEEEIINHCGINYFTNPPCVSASNGSIQIQAFANSLPYQFTWQNTITGESNTGTATENDFTLSNLHEGIYNLTITDSNNTELTEENIILSSIPGSIFEIIEITTTNSSNTISNGAIHLNIAGGFPPYTYQWSGTETGSQSGVDSLNFSIQNIEAGEYTIIVTDNNSTQQTVSLTLLDETVPVFPCTQPLDIVILNDVSGSVDAIEYTESKQFFVDFLEEANIGTGADESRAAIIEWSNASSQSVQIPITDNLSTLQNYIDNTRAFDSGTAPHEAMTFGKNYLDTNARPDVEKVLILSTDGSGGQVSPSLIDLADQFKAEGYHIITIAFDNAFSNITTREILRQVASIDLLAPGSPAYSQLDENLAENIVNIYLCPIDPGSSATVYFERDGAIDILDIEAVGGCPVPEFAELTFSVEALRELSVPSGMPVTFYYNNPAIFGATPILTWEIPCAIEAGTIDTFMVSLPVTTAANIFAVLNDDGILSPPIQLPLTEIDELAYSNNVADTMLCGQALPTLQTFKYTTTPVPICNNTVIYQVDVCNISSLDATGVVIEDDAPAGFVLVDALVNDNGCSTANADDFSIPAGCCVSITYIYDASAAANGSYDNQDVDISGITNQIYLDFDGYGTPAEDVLIDGTVDCPSTEINFTKSVNVDESCDDAFVVYTFTIDNQMNIPLNAVSFSDLLPSPVTWAFQPYGLTGLSISNADINGNSATFLIDEIAANTVASFSMDAALNDWTAAGSLDNTASLSNVLDLANGGLQTLSSNSISTFINVDSDMQIEWTANCAVVDLSAFLDSAMSDTWEWQTLGDGSFTDSLSANTVYIPGIQDLSDDSFTLLIKVQSECGEINKTVEVIIEEPTPVPLELATCTGTTIVYEGVSLSIGDNMEFTLEDVLGCDSIVAVNVVGLANDATELTLETCEGTTIDYENVTLNVGDSTDFIFENYLGCDSVVTVSVLSLDNDATELILEICENATISYQNTELNAGETQVFTFQNMQGCDSTVTVIVNGQTLQNETLTFEACAGELVDYNGTWLAVNESVDFLFTDQNGCDSTVSVNVIALPISEENLIFQSCVNEAVNYQDSLLNVGDEATFIFENYLGCDSIVIVSVEVGGGTEDFAIPNVFTPNNDGMNDCFQMVNPDDTPFKSFDLQVFNRWGNIVFSTSNPTDCWNGKVNGQDATADVYVWVLNAETEDCEVGISEIGDLTLVR